MVVFGVLGFVAIFASSLEAAVGCVEAALEASFAMSGGVFADVFAEGPSFSKEC